MYSSYSLQRSNTAQSLRIFSAILYQLMMHQSTIAATCLVSSESLLLAMMVFSKRDLIRFKELWLEAPIDCWICSFVICSLESCTKDCRELDASFSGLST